MFMFMINNCKNYNNYNNNCKNYMIQCNNIMLCIFYKGFSRVLYYIIDGLLYLKYFVYFNFFIFALCSNILYTKMSKRLNNKLVNLLSFSTNLNGCVLIKFIQWMYTNIDILKPDNVDVGSSANANDFEYLDKIFSKFYEDCNIHSINYTKKIFEKDFNLKLDNVVELDKNFNIKSGSIAQIYKGRLKKEFVEAIGQRRLGFGFGSDNGDMEMDIAIKVVHPDIIYQKVFPILFIKLYKYLSDNIYFLNKYSVVFNFDSFFSNIEKQFSMINEFDNITYFYDTYKDNEYIMIPKPICCRENILIMEYIDSMEFSSLNINELKKQKIIMLLNMFIKDTYMFQDKYHSDLHDSNWKVMPHKDFYKVVIYDFGYIINNQIPDTFQQILYYADTRDFENLANHLFINLINPVETLEIFREKYCTFVRDNQTIVDFFKITYMFLHYNKYQLKNELLEIFISMILFKKHLDNYIFPKTGTTSPNLIIKMNIIYLNFCKKLNIFPNIQTYIQKYYLNNQKLLDTYSHQNSYFDDLNNDSVQINQIYSEYLVVDNSYDI